MGEKDKYRLCAVFEPASRRKLHVECPAHDRSVFQQDCDRIVHTSAFRRLMHKTQVFFSPDSDHVRTRLTHTIEVSRAARSLANRLRLNADLAEAVALAHDLGHPPFGHAGEEVLAELLNEYGGFDHNSQAIRTVTLIVKTYPEFDGLNLSWDCLEGIAKHNGPLVRNVPYSILEYNLKHDLELETYASAEAQVAALADDIAYNCHDMQDGIRAGMFKLEHIRQLPIVGPLYWKVRKRYPDLNDHRTMHSIVRHTFGLLMDDLAKSTEVEFHRNEFQSADEVRGHEKGIASFSSDCEKELDEIRQFLRENMYLTEAMSEHRFNIKQIITHIFEHFLSSPTNLPAHWQCELSERDDAGRARVAADYIAGMTDNFAISTYSEIMGLTGALTMQTVPHMRK